MVKPLQKETGRTFALLFYGAAPQKKNFSERRRPDSQRPVTPMRAETMPGVIDRVKGTYLPAPLQILMGNTPLMRSRDNPCLLIH